jgi:hypothetical protein
MWRDTGLRYTPNYYAFNSGKRFDSLFNVERGAKVSEEFKLSKHFQFIFFTRGGGGIRTPGTVTSTAV